MDKVAEFIRDPGSRFRDPNELLARTDLAAGEKLQILQNWHADLVELLKATEENMAGAGSGTGTNAAQLSRVSDAISRLESQAARAR
jgi:hypothetical protein